MPLKYTKFQFFLYEKLVLSNKISVEEISKRIPMPASTLYNYLEGQTVCPIELLAPFYNATKDIDFLNFIIDDTDQRLVPKNAGNSRKSIIEETLDIASSSGALITAVQDALRNGLIVNSKKREIIRAINKTQKELEDLRRKID